MTATSVWIKLYMSKDDQNPSVIYIKGTIDNVYELKEKIKEKKTNDLKDIAADRLEVYPQQGTDASSIEEGNALNPWDPVPQSTTGQIPLIVMPNEQWLQRRLQVDQDDPSTKKRRMDDLLAYHRAVLETGTSKSSKLLKGEDTLHTFGILRGWTNGLGWGRPFKIHEPMNLIWLCHKHKIAFDSHSFGLTLMGLDNGVGFCSYDSECDDLVEVANNRLRDANEAFYDMNYVSRRAVGMRIFKAHKSGHYLNHEDTGAWEAIVRLSAAASIDQNARSGSEDGDEEATT